MKNEVWVRDEIQSPCVKICVIHPAARICTGCLRTMDEITAWSRMTPEARHDIMQALPAREVHIKTRRGGRAERLKDRT